MTHSELKRFSTSIESAMRLFEAQAVLFASNVSRLALHGLDLPAVTANTVLVNVWRNHSFEPIINLSAPYFAFGGWHAEFRLGDYDDTLMFYDRQTADADVLWLDSSRFLESISFEEWLNWLDGRLRALRAVSMVPIILATWVENNKNQTLAIKSLVDSLPAVYFADLYQDCEEANLLLLDTRSSNLAGTPISRSAQLFLARKFACHWLPGTLLPPMKALVLDLDNTLHHGVLGEDGIEGVRLTIGHSDLQKYIVTLRQQGIFIALVSRNKLSDVEALFSQRADYPLKFDDFSVVEVSWEDKAVALERVAKTLRIATDAVIFVDDNPGELANIAIMLQKIHAVYAHQDADITRQVIHYYPGLWRWNSEGVDALRIHDHKFNSERVSLAKSMLDPAEYFRSLKVSLTYFQDNKFQLNRLADLSGKTNQFNLSLRRFNQAELSEYMNREDACVASVQLTDRLSDSGIIAIIAAVREKENLIVEELCISCRALGRKLEDTIILLALRKMPIFSDCKQVVFEVRFGPRNQPAMDWLVSLLNVSELPAQGPHIFQARQILEFSTNDGIAIKEG